MPLVTLLGVPWDASSSFQRGAAAAPPRIRHALRSPSTNTCNERGDDLAAAGVLEDLGDLNLPASGVAARAAVEQRIRQLVDHGQTPLVLGGDHSITLPILRGFSARPRRPVVLHVDAHTDLYDEFPSLPPATEDDDAADGAGDRFSHACPFARVMEEQLAERLVQVGIRTLTAHQREQAVRFGVEIFGADRWRDALAVIGGLDSPVYVSIDLDVVEPMLAPGVSHPEPGGLGVRDVIDLLHAIRAPVVGADVVEYNPANDVRDLTARVAAKFVKELVGAMRGGGG